MTCRNITWYNKFALIGKGGDKRGKKNDIRACPRFLNLCTIFDRYYYYFFIILKPGFT